MFARRTFQLSSSRALRRAIPRASPAHAMSTNLPRVNDFPEVHMGAFSDTYPKKTAFPHPLSPAVREVEEKSHELSPTNVVRAHVNAGADASFRVTNLASVRSMHKLWMEELPMVKPFYAVKCNPDPLILRLLASLGCGFDCATQGEIDLVMNRLGKEHNISPAQANSSIIYAHPAKMTPMIRYAIDQNVGMTVFDGEDELIKMASVEGIENMKVLLRLTTDDKASVCRFSKKFGCPVEEAPNLLKIAKSLGINVVGCSFHVGSGCGDPAAYTTALEHCRQTFEAAEHLGMEPFTVIDIGGGFPGDSSGYGGPDMPSFQELASAIREGIATFCDGGWTSRSIDDITFMAEPGRFFASASTTIASKVYARKGGRSTAHQALFLDDGVYGSLNNVLYDHATPIPRKLARTASAEAETESASHQHDGIPTAVFGPTCDGLDVICNVESTLLPRCEVDDWLLFDNCGAYTHTASFFFNGYTHSPTTLYCSFEE